MMNSQVMMPNGYKLLTEGVDDNNIYSFEAPGGFRPQEWWTWKLGAIDAMWDNVRHRATKEAVPGRSIPERELKNNTHYAMGYCAGRDFVDAEVRLTMARAGYVFDPEITAIQTVQKLLVMLNGPRNEPNI